MHGSGLLVSQIFWGLWLIPFGLLVMRSGFIPRALGIFLMLACSGYLASSFTLLLLPQHAPLVSRFTSVLVFGELPIVFWLSIWGAKDEPANVDKPATAGPPAARNATI